jgi:hypothetical protein
VAWVSTEVDLAFLDDPDANKADSVDGAIGELSPFHLEFNYYAQGVEAQTAMLPDGWRERVVAFTALSSEPAAAVCLDPYDLVMSKLVAMRAKDLGFAMALLESGLLDVSALRARADLLTAADPITCRRVKEWIEGAGRRIARP